MKKVMVFIAILFSTALLLLACSNDDGTTGQTAQEQDDTGQKDNSGEDQSEAADADNNSEDQPSNEQNETDEDNHQAENPSENEDNDALSEYSEEEIEYARVWLQLGDTQDIDALHAESISAGEPLNPDDETSIDYPEDVVQLTGSRLAEGSITYSSNHDGSITWYKKIPQRWDGKNPAGEDVYKDIIEATEQVSIEPGDDEKVEALIEKLDIDS